MATLTSAKRSKKNTKKRANDSARKPAAPKRRKVTRKQLGEELGVSPSTVSRWIADGVEVDADGLIDLDAAAEYMTRIRRARSQKAAAASHGVDVSEISGGMSELTRTARQADLRWKEAKARREELRAQMEAGLSMPIEDVRKLLGLVIGTARRKFLSLGREIALELEGLDVHEREGVIDERIREVLEEMAANPLEGDQDAA